MLAHKRMLRHLFGFERRKSSRVDGAAHPRVAKAIESAPMRRRVAEKKTILVAEASDRFAFMLRRAFAQAGLPHVMRRVQDGAEAIRYLAGQGEFGDRQKFPHPDLLVVGSGLPKISGVEVLGYLRGEMGLEIPVVVFAPGVSAVEMRRVVELGWAEYLVRPDVYSVLLEEVDGIERRWLEQE